MLQALPQNRGKLLAYKVGGLLRQPDLEKVGKRLDRIDGKARLLLELDDLRGLTPAAFWEDLKITLGHFRDIERMAVVGDQRWLRWWVRTAGALVSVQVKVYTAEEKSVALKWLRER